MTQSFIQRDSAVLKLDATLSALYAPVEAELIEAEAVLRGEMRSAHGYVDELVRYGCMLGGKRLRPALLLLTAKVFGPITRTHLVLAAVVEMIHTATLIHDDVLDDAQTRRHLATINSRWDNKASVLLGDFLFTHAFYLSSTLETTWACRQIGRATNIVCEGELRQKGSRGEFSLGEDEYLEIIAAKTAELCACSCQLGAHFASASPGQIESMLQFGRELGIAFQIIDDVLDLLGDEETIGKSLGTDLEQQKPTLPIIRSLSQATAEDRREIIEILQAGTANRLKRLLPMLERYEANQYAREVARSYLERAYQRLESLPAGGPRDALARITDFVVARTR